MEFRDIDWVEFSEFLGVLERCMGRWPPPVEKIERERGRLHLDRNCAAVDQGKIVGTASSRQRQLTLPGGHTVSVAGVTRVSVLPTHRRRGIGTQLVKQQLKMAMEQGEIAAILIPSESGIYARFGFGRATQKMNVEIETSSVALQCSSENCGHSVCFIDSEQMRNVCPQVFDLFRRGWVGQIERPSWWWDDCKHEGEKRGEEYVLVKDENGVTQGFCRYHIDPVWNYGLYEHTLFVHDLFGLKPAAWHTLWEFVLHVDLIRVVNIPHRPLDDPLWWLLKDPRRVQVKSMEEMLWLRILDVERFLESRRYGMDGTLVLELYNVVESETGFRVRLNHEAGQVQCIRCRDKPDLTLGIDGLGSLSLGGVSWRTLAEAGRVNEGTTGAVEKADAMFRWSPSPWCSTWF